jgi:hypothetical protein
MDQTFVERARTAIKLAREPRYFLPPKLIVTMHVHLVNTILLCDEKIPFSHKIAISAESRKQRKNRLASIVHEPKPTIGEMFACRVQSRFKLVHYRPHFSQESFKRIEVPQVLVAVFTGLSNLLGDAVVLKRLSLSQ